MSTAKLSLSKTQENHSAESLRPQESPALAAWRALLRHRSGMVGLTITLTMLLLALAAPWIASHEPLSMTSADRFVAPSLTYPLGTDAYGRDIFSRVLHGGRIAFSVGGISTLIATVIGVAIGAVAGYLQGWIDAVSMRVLDAILAFPAILLAVVILAVLGPGPLNATLAVAIVNIPVFARLTRANVLAEKPKEYVLAARAIGSPAMRILFGSILPNSFATIIVQITVSFASAILLESSLSFLGLGVLPPAPSWGAMLSDARAAMGQAPWYPFAPGLAIMLLVLGVYLLGDGMRDVLDPRRQKSV